MTVQLASSSLVLGRFAKAIGMGRGVLSDAAAYAEGQREVWRDTPAALLTLRSAVNAIQTGDAAGMAAAPAYNLLLPAIRGNELLSRILGLRRAPLNVSLPALTGGATAYVVAEGQAKPLTKFTRGDAHDHAAQGRCRGRRHQ